MTQYLNKNETMDMWEEAIQFCDENDETKKKQNQIDANNKDNLYYKIEKCKICKTEVKLSCKYDGNYPLCDKHRKPNDRLDYKKK